MAVVLVLFQTVTTAHAAELSLTADEQAWLEAHPVVRVGADFYAPVVLFEGVVGPLEGVAGDYLAAAADRLGVRFDVVLRTHQSHGRVMRSLREGEVDLVPAVMANHPDIRAGRAAATTAYLEIPVVIVTRVDAPRVDTLRALRSQRVAAVPPIAGRLREMEFEAGVEVAPPHLGLSGVATGRWDAYIGDLPTITHHLGEQAVTNVKINGELPMPSRVAMAVRPEDAVLVRLLDRAFEAIPAEERDAIWRRWFRVTYEQSLFVSPWLWGGAIAFLVMLGVVLARVRRLSKRVRTIQATVDSLDQHLLSAHLDAEGRIAEVTNALCMAIGFASVDLLGRRLSEVGAPAATEDMPVERLMEAVFAGRAWTGEFALSRNDGTSLWAKAVVSPRRRKGETVGFTVLWQDISESKRYRDLSMSDELTGLFNRRCFNAQAPKRLADARENGILFCLISIDVDNFKAYNDTYGHAAGDRVLATVGDVLREGLRREDDLAFRLGGEEFVVTFAVVEGADARRMAEDLRHRLQARAIPHRKAPSGVVTASFGLVVSGPGNTCDVEALLAAADTALYAAKHDGRNRVAVAGSLGGRSQAGTPELTLITERSADHSGGAANLASPRSPSAMPDELDPIPPKAKTL